MKVSYSSLPCLLLVPLLLGAAMPAGAQVGGEPLMRSLARLESGTVGFVPNHGQWEADVLFHAEVGGAAVTFLAEGVLIRAGGDGGLHDAEALAAGGMLPGQAGVEEQAQLPPAFHLTWEGGKDAPVVEGVGLLGTRYNYFLGARSATNVQAFEVLTYRDVVEGIDLQFRSTPSGLAYDVLADAGAELESLRLRMAPLAVDGVKGDHAEGGVLERTTLREAGRMLEIGEGATGLGASQVIGDCWQTSTSGERMEVAVSFERIAAAAGGVEFGFEASEWNSALPLVIDPTVLLFGTYVGGGNFNYLDAMEVSHSGAAYLTCRGTNGSPTTPGAYLEGLPGSVSTWVGQVSPDGSNLVWATFLGGSVADAPKDLALLADGSLIITGLSSSPDFPTTPGVVQPLKAGVSGTESFITRIGPSGDQLIWSTYLGGSQGDSVKKVAVGGDGLVYLVYGVISSDFPVTSNGFDPLKDPNDLFLVGLAADGTAALYSTFFSCTAIRDVVVSGEGDVYLLGANYPETGLAPTTPGAWRETPFDVEGSDGVIARLSADLSSLKWCTYYGGTASDLPYEMEVALSGAVFVCGYGVSQGDSTEFGFPAGSLTPTVPPFSNVSYAVKLSSNGEEVLAGTFLDPSVMSGLALDEAGQVHVVGNSKDPNCEVTPDAFQPQLNGSKSDAVYYKLDPFFESLEYGTFLGGTGTDYYVNVGLDLAGRPILGMTTFSSNMPLAGVPFQRSLNGENNLFVASFDLSQGSWQVQGNQLVGSYAPDLVGYGEPVLNEPMRLSIRGGKPNGAMWLVVGLSEANTPFAGGIAQPAPKYLFPLQLDATGGTDVLTKWPGFNSDVWVQAWGPDAGGPLGWNATNGLRVLH